MISVDSLLFQAAERFESAIGTARHQLDASLSHRVWSRWHNSLQRLLPPGAHSIIPGYDNTPQSDDESVESWTEEFWVCSPFSSYVVTSSSDGVTDQSVVSEAGWAFKNSARVWKGNWPREESQRAFEQSLDPKHPIIALAFLQPWRFLEHLKIESARESMYLGRPALSIYATPAYSALSVVESGNENTPLIFEGADSSHFVIDLERGTILRWAGIADGQEYETTEVTALSFDTDIPPNRFDPRQLEGD